MTRVRRLVVHKDQEDLIREGTVGQQKVQLDRWKSTDACWAVRARVTRSGASGSALARFFVSRTDFLLASSVADEVEALPDAALRFRVGAGFVADVGPGGISPCVASGVAGDFFESAFFVELAGPAGSAIATGVASAEAFARAGRGVGWRSVSNTCRTLRSEHTVLVFEDGLCAAGTMNNGQLRDDLTNCSSLWNARGGRGFVFAVA
jgi:hypothetical protein